MFEFDSGSSGAEGPFINWSARGTQDRIIDPESFYLRDGDQKMPLEAFATGVVMDIHGLKTGWQRSDGVKGQAPEWRWNASPARMEQQPGDDYKKGFEVRCAIGAGKAATWQQAGAAVWGALTALAPQFQSGPDGKLPVVKMIGTKPVQFSRGSTVEPVLTVASWVDRPDCLKEGAAAGIDVGQPEQPAQPAQPAAPAPAAASVPSDAAF